MSKLIKVIAFGVILGCLGLGMDFFKKSDFFKIKKLTCRVDNRICLPEEEKDFLPLLGQSIWQVDIKSVAAEELSRHPVFKNIELKPALPNQLKIIITKRHPVGAVSLADQSVLFFDNDGIIFDGSGFDQSLPKLTVYPGFPLAVGIFSDQLVKTSQLITLTSDYQIRLSALSLDQPQTLIAQIGSSTVYFNLNNDIAGQVASLQLILSRSKIEGKSFSKLDLRFSKPVITFN